MNISCYDSINPCHQMVQPKEVKILHNPMQGKDSLSVRLGVGLDEQAGGGLLLPLRFCSYSFSCTLVLCFSFQLI